jgi:hypothetical protein
MRCASADRGKETARYTEKAAGGSSSSSGGGGAKGKSGGRSSTRHRSVQYMPHNLPRMLPCMYSMFMYLKSMACVVSEVYCTDVPS